MLQMTGGLSSGFGRFYSPAMMSGSTGHLGMSGAGMTIAINVDRLFRWHLICIGFFAAAYLFTVACFELFGFGSMKGLTRLFSLDAEQNLPTLFSVGALLLTAAVCWLCAQQSKKEEKAFWKPMALVFAYLTMDEAVSIHELLAEPIREYFHLGGVFAFAWVIPYGVALLLFLLFVCGRLMRLPAKTRHGLCLAGIVFVAGAIGFEMAGAWVKYSGVMPWMTQSLAFSLCVLCEETLEMLGIALALRTCLRHLAQQSGTVNVAVAITP